MTEEHVETLTELEAATAYARAWNRLDCGDFLSLLDLDASYASQWVFEELEGRHAIEEYLTGKMETVRNSARKVYAELGTTLDGRDCVLMAQDNRDEVKAVILFEVSEDRILQYDMCMPEMTGFVRSGIYPV